jgi:uncharacterized protein YlxW (UPF0749 family)
VPPAAETPTPAPAAGAAAPVERRRPPQAYAPDFLTALLRNPLEPGYAEAVGRRAARPRPTGVRRRVERGLLLAVLVLTGLLLAVAYRQVVVGEPAAGQARSQLREDVRERRSSANDLQARADELRDRVARERDAALGGQDEVRRLRALEAATGVVRVRGDGVVVRLADAAPKLDPVTGKPAGNNLGRIVDRDLQEITNELWRSGAEAVAVNGQRLTATATIRAAGGVILVDFRPVTSPYQVAAIGPDDLERRFNASPTARKFRSYVGAYGMQFGVKKQPDLTLAAAADPRLRHAVTPPAPGPSGAASPGAGPSSPRPAAPSRSGGTR